jgi:hypothetical protein
VLSAHAVGTRRVAGVSCDVERQVDVRWWRQQPCPRPSTAATLAKKKKSCAGLLFMSCAFTHSIFATAGQHSTRTFFHFHSVSLAASSAMVAYVYDGVYFPIYVCYIRTSLYILS